MYIGLSDKINKELENLTNTLSDRVIESMFRLVDKIEPEHEDKEVKEIVKKMIITLTFEKVAGKAIDIAKDQGIIEKEGKINVK